MSKHYGMVTGGGLNLRERNSTTSTSLTLIPNETTILVEEYDEEWYAAQYGAHDGFVMRKYITLFAQDTDVSHSGTVTGGSLNLRRKATVASDALTQISDNTEIEVVDFDENSEWYRTSYRGYAGYVMKKFVTLTVPHLPGWQYGRVTSSTLNVRKEPSSSAALWNGVWPKDRIALVKPALDGWYETLYRGEPAYVSTDFIELMDSTVPDSIVERMMFLAVPELGRNNSIYFNGYSGAWCHRFADWLAMHAAMPKNLIPNNGNCGEGIVWFVNNKQSGGFYFKNAEHKARMLKAYPAINHLPSELTEVEKIYIPVPGNYIYFRWASASASVNVNHVGIVREVSSGVLTTFEGNSNDHVVSREFSLDDEQILGYGVPRYDKA